MKTQTEGLAEERAAQAAYKAAQRASKARSGLKRLEVWVLPDSVTEVRRIEHRDRDFISRQTDRSAQSGVE